MSLKVLKKKGYHYKKRAKWAVKSTFLREKDFTQPLTGRKTPLPLEKRFFFGRTKFFPSTERQLVPHVEDLSKNLRNVVMFKISDLSKTAYFRKRIVRTSHSSSGVEKEGLQFTWIKKRPIIRFGFQKKGFSAYFRISQVCKEKKRCPKICWYFYISLTTHFLFS